MICIWLILNANGARWCRLVEEHTDNLGIGENVKVGVVSAL